MAISLNLKNGVRAGKLMHPNQLFQIDTLSIEMTVHQQSWQSAMWLPSGSTLHPTNVFTSIIYRRFLSYCLTNCDSQLYFVLSIRSLNVFDIIDLNSLVFMYKAFHNLLPTNLLSYFKKLMTAIIITQEIILSVPN